MRFKEYMKEAIKPTEEQNRENYLQNIKELKKDGVVIVDDKKLVNWFYKNRDKKAKHGSGYSDMILTDKKEIDMIMKVMKNNWQDKTKDGDLKGQIVFLTDDHKTSRNIMPYTINYYKYGMSGIEGDPEEIYISW